MMKKVRWLLGLGLVCCGGLLAVAPAMAQPLKGPQNQTTVQTPRKQAAASESQAQPLANQAVQEPKDSNAQRRGDLRSALKPSRLKNEDAAAVVVKPERHLTAQERVELREQLRHLRQQEQRKQQIQQQQLQLRSQQ